MAKQKPAVKAQRTAAHAKRRAAATASPRSWRRWQARRRWLALAVVAAFAVLGVVTLLHSLAATVPTGAVVNGVATCLDNKRNNFVNSNPVQLYTCNSGIGQQWALMADSTIRVNGFCLDAKRAGITPMTPVQIYTCNGGTNQKWILSGSQIINQNAGLCLDDKRNNPNPMAIVQLYTCNGGIGQHWSLPKIAPPTPVASSKPVTLPAPAKPAPVTTPKPNPTPTPAPSVPTTPQTLYVNPVSFASKQAASWGGTGRNTLLMKRLATMPIAEWYGSWTPTISVNQYVSQATALHQMPVLVAYNIPNRDCGSYSSGGAANAGAYASWIQTFANGIGKRSAIVILEPDALAANCVNDARISMIADAVKRLHSTTNAAVYIDAGHPGYGDAATMADRLRRADVADAAGFAQNVANFKTDADNIAHGKDIAGRIGNKHFVIDTGRNGNGSNGQWCNPSGRALGRTPTLATGTPLVDAYLWIKKVGASDGTCNGGPAAGQWWPNYALGLMTNAGW